MKMENAELTEIKTKLDGIIKKAEEREKEFEIIQLKMYWFIMGFVVGLLTLTIVQVV
jgi:hypothetical protein